MSFRIGFGYDVHALEKGDGLVLGGIKIEYHKSAIGHSDADVLLHAICDALLGAACLGDIGTHFPPTDPTYKGIDSKILLEKTVELIFEKDYSISNLDTTIVLQKPKIAKYISEMQKIISGILHVNPDCVSIKATTTEHLGFIGREEGIAAYATVLLEKK